MNPRLNVHAKEFQMRHEHDLQNSRSSVNLTYLAQAQHTPIGLQHSRSSGNVLRHPHHPIPAPQPQPAPPPMVAIPLLQSASSGNIMHPSPRVHFQLPMFGYTPRPAIAQQQQQPRHDKPQPGGALKRSKSMSAADSASLAAKLKSLALQAEAPDLGQFPPEIQAHLKLVIDDPNKLPSRTLMELAKHIMERIVEGRRYSLPGAKLCTTIIERERTETFLESLINICQQWYQERDKLLRNVKAGDGSKFTAFMWFLTEMSCQLKRRQLQLKTQCEGIPPGLVLLTILVKCCQTCVQSPIKSLAEIECLFFVLTSIGKDLEQELPQQLDQLLISVRDGFLASAAVPTIRKTLLQLIELKASNWQLSGPTVLYYYPKMK